MANIQAIKNGNWSDATIWEYGAVPTTGDTVYANSCNITLDQDITCAELKNTALASTYLVPYNVVPIMSNNTTPSGYIASNYVFFDSNYAAGVTVTSSLDITIQLPSAVVAKYFCLLRGPNNISTTNMYGSNDGVSWSASLCSHASANQIQFSNLSSNSTAYSYYKFTTTVGGSYALWSLAISTGTVLPTVTLGNANGYFNKTTAGTIQANITANTTPCLYVYPTTGTGTVVNIGSVGTPVTITGGGTGGKGIQLEPTAICTCNIYANIVGGSTTTSYGLYAHATSQSIINITGTVNSFYNGAANTATINGNVISIGSGLYGVEGYGTLTVNGNTTSSSTGALAGMYLVCAGKTVTINGNITGGSASSCAGIRFDGGTFNITNCTLSAGSYSATSPAFSLTTGTIVNFTGDITQKGVYPLSSMITLANTAFLNVIGNIYGSTVAGGVSTVYVIQNNGTGAVTITGGVTMYDVSLSATLGLIQNTSTGTFSVGANVTAGSVSNQICISNGGTKAGTNTAKVSVTGNLIGGGNATMNTCYYSTVSNELDVTGSVTSGSHPTIYSTNATAIHKLRGNIIWLNGINPIFTQSVLCTSQYQTIRMQEYAVNANRDFTAGVASSNFPSITKVRSGIVFGDTNQYTGTDIVPPYASVQLNVPVDDTLGTGVAIINPTDVWNVPISSLTVTDSIGKKLTKSATIASVSAQITALK